MMWTAAGRRYIWVTVVFLVEGFITVSTTRMSRSGASRVWIKKSVSHWGRRIHSLTPFSPPEVMSQFNYVFSRNINWMERLGALFEGGSDCDLKISVVEDGRPVQPIYAHGLILRQNIRDAQMPLSIRTTSNCSQHARDFIRWAQARPRWRQRQGQKRANDDVCFSDTSTQERSASTTLPASASSRWPPTGVWQNFGTRRQTLSCPSFHRTTPFRARSPCTSMHFHPSTRHWWTLSIIIWLGTLRAWSRLHRGQIFPLVSSKRCWLARTSWWARRPLFCKIWSVGPRRREWRLSLQNSCSSSAFQWSRPKIYTCSLTPSTTLGGVKLSSFTLCHTPHKAVIGQTPTAPHQGFTPPSRGATTSITTKWNILGNRVHPAMVAS